MPHHDQGRYICPITKRLNNMRYLLFFSCFLLVSCTTSRPLIPKNQYDEQVSFYSKKVNPGKKSKNKHLKGLETAYHNANQLDLYLADSMLAYSETAQWPYINHVYRRMKTRDQKIQTLLPLISKEGIAPRFVLNSHIDSLEQYSRVQAASFLYTTALTLLERSTTENRLLARESYQLLDNLKQNYFPDWAQTDSLIQVAKNTGTTWFLVDYQGSPFYSYQFWDYFFRNDHHLSHSFWHQYDLQPVAGRTYHYLLQLDLETLNIGMDTRQESCQTVSKEVQDGETVKKDSSGQVIERTPIMVTVSATITTATLSKSSDARMYLSLINNATGAVQYTNTLFSSHYFEETACSISGDSRAADGICCSGVTWLSSPSDWDVARELAQDLQRKTGSDLWSETLSL